MLRAPVERLKVLAVTKAAVETPKAAVERLKVAVETLKVQVEWLKAPGRLGAGFPKRRLRQCNRVTVRMPRGPMCAYWDLPAISANYWR